MEHALKHEHALKAHLASMAISTKQGEDQISSHTEGSPFSTQVDITPPEKIVVCGFIHVEMLNSAPLWFG